MASTTSEKRGLFRLLSDVPALIIQLVRDEIDSLKRELTEKLKGIAIGAVLFVVAGVFALFALVALVIAAIYALALVLPTWAAALIVAGALLLIALAFVAVGVAQVKRGDLKKSAESIKHDVNAIKGIGKRD
jgi:cytochrome c biogenesis protein CcdA